MNIALKKLCLVFASAAFLFAAGCNKKPKRPDPSSTVLGPGAGGDIGGGSLTPLDASSTLDPNSMLSSRDAGFDINNQNRDILKDQTVYFDFDSSSIKASERSKLQFAAKYLQDNPTHALLIEGHCDWRGTEEYNVGLGDRRANAAKAYLTTIGISADRVEVTSKGSLEATKNADDAASARDRRGDLIVVKR